MRKFILTAVLIGATVVIYAQGPKRSIIYDYDAVGNRIARSAYACSCTENFTNQIVNTNTTMVICDNINVQNVIINATLTIKTRGVITIGSGVVVGSYGKLILDTQGNRARVVIDDKYDLNSGDFEIK